MSITDELRKFANGSDWIGCTASVTARKMLDVADRIDAEYQKAEDEWKAKGGQSWLNGYEECRVGLMEGNEVIAASLEEAGWVKLPLDADGVPIHIGDVMAYADDTKPMQVVALVPPSVFMVEDGPRYADMCRHYHAPTVEDELTDLCERVWESALLGGTWSDSPVESYIAEYAAKLQLKERK